MGKVEIGQEAMDPFELVRRVEVGGGGAEMGAEVRGGLQNPGGGGAHGDDAACTGDFFLQAGADFVFFLVHGMVAEIGGFNGAKGSEADMEGDKGVV